jgi:8-oxo-dGTP pyrophosphatase MutT (NUDIX family)
MVLGRILPMRRANSEFMAKIVIQRKPHRGFAYSDYAPLQQARFGFAGDALQERWPKQVSIKTLQTRWVYRNRWLRVREDQIERSDGSQGIYGVVEKDDCAVILPVDGDFIYLVEQFRYTVQARCLELPQGGWEKADVDPEELARGELREETGLRADKMQYLGWAWIAYGFARQKQHVFLATGLTPGKNDPEPEEHDLQLHRISVAEFECRLRDGRITDGCTLAAWALYKLKARS